MKTVTPILLTMLCALVFTTPELQAQTLLAEGFEGTLDPRISINSTGNLSPGTGVAPSSHFGSNNAFRFGKSSCPANCYNNDPAYQQPYMGMFRITFPSPVLVASLTFKWAEIGANWGSGGMVYLDQSMFGSYPTQYIGISPPSLWQVDPTIKTWSNAINQSVTTIDIIISDIANGSEIWIDDIAVTGYTPVAVDAGADQLLSLGYGPQSATLTAVASGGLQPYSYLWSDNQIGAPISVSPLVPTTYTVTVTDALGQTATDDVFVDVVDLRCGNNLDKVVVCHNGHEICIASEAVPAHLAHGDYLGDCGIAKRATAKPETLALPRNYPNPFNPSTVIEYDIPRDGKVQLVVFDLFGREVSRLVDGVKDAGRHKVLFDGSGLPSGVFIYRVEWMGHTINRRMTLLK